MGVISPDYRPGRTVPRGGEDRDEEGDGGVLLTVIWPGLHQHCSHLRPDQHWEVPCDWDLWRNWCGDNLSLIIHWDLFKVIQSSLPGPWGASAGGLGDGEVEEEVERGGDSGDTTHHLRPAQHHPEGWGVSIPTLHGSETWIINNMLYILLFLECFQTQGRSCTSCLCCCWWYPDPVSRHHHDEHDTWQLAAICF